VQVVKGREDIYFSSRLHGLPDDVVRYYVRILESDRHALRGSFGQYRAFDAGGTRSAPTPAGSSNWSPRRRSRPARRPCSPKVCRPRGPLEHDLGDRIGSL
jgi:hypothetical protein